MIFFVDFVVLLTGDFDLFFEGVLFFLGDFFGGDLTFLGALLSLNLDFDFPLLNLDDFNVF